MKIIGITGKARSGKDTVGNYLCLKHNFVQLSFAAPIKRMVTTLLNRGEDWIEEHKEKFIPGLESPRVLMQTLGTEWGRNIIDENIWINLVSREINNLMTQHAHPVPAGVVITDCRFENEAEWIHRQGGGRIWQVIRFDAPEIPSHSSEAGLSTNLVDEILLNNSGYEKLYQRIEEILK